tara:strand:- start:80 stop:586 length:507 start_codon:yes stop_codon:yes gene_type:complete
MKINSMKLINSKKVIINTLVVIIIFLIDRFSKFYILDIAEVHGSVDVYISDFINFYLVWNTGIGFGLLSLDHNFFYNSLTCLIVLINVFIVYLIITAKDYRAIFLSMLLGGSLGNLFDRIYYSAVPDFIDFHINSFHWFIFNVADIFISLGIFCLIVAEIVINKKNNG